MTTTLATDLTHLWARLSAVESRVRQAVAHRLADDPTPNDPHRGLYLTTDTVQRILDNHPAPLPPPDLDHTTDPESRLHTLSERFRLTPLDVEFLLVAIAPDIDPRFERLYAYLNDDVTRRRATVNLALELYGLPRAGPARFRLAPSAPLVTSGLIEVQDPDLPALTRSLRVPDRIVAHLLGHDEPTTTAHLTHSDQPPTALAERIGNALHTGPVHLRDTDGDASQVAIDALAAAGHHALVVNVPALTADTPLTALVREARLHNAGLVLGPLEPLLHQRTHLIQDLTSLATHVPLLLHSRRHWDPHWTTRPVVSVPVPPLTPGQRARRWTQSLTDATGTPPDPTLIADLAGYRLGTDQVDRAVTAAAHLALLDRRPITLRHLRAGVRAQNGAGLEQLARRVTPAVDWDDLVLPEPTRRQLDELVLRARHRDRVLGEWRMRPGGGRGRGVVALFAGESGTGKTLSAEVVAGAIGMDLYVIDLSSVVDKYIGETEKNLERIFTEAAGVHGVLLFDEADAVFGKRSEVNDAHDRHANTESAYLLQRMESFDGIAVLTTNLRSNMDEAFTRRIDVIADFPIPDNTQRLALWDRCLGPHLPRATDLDLDFCADRFELAGGSIRACAVTAAYLAAANDRPVHMADVMSAVHQEYRKLGRLILPTEFGPWLDVH